MAAGQSFPFGIFVKLSLPFRVYFAEDFFINISSSLRIYHHGLKLKEDPEEHEQQISFCQVASFRGRVNVFRIRHGLRASSLLPCL